MPEFIWNAELEVGVEAMDQEHKILIGLMNDFYHKSAAGEEHQVLLHCAEMLWDYVVKHFADEEQYMESFQFPGLDTHKRLHANLLEELKIFLEALKKEHAPEAVASFSIFLSFWLATHIRGIDFKYGDYVKNLAAAAP